jgi:hypothetical protein
MRAACINLVESVLQRAVVAPDRRSRDRSLELANLTLHAKRCRYDIMPLYENGYQINILATDYSDR